MGPSVLKGIVFNDIRIIIDIGITIFCMLIWFRCKQLERIKNKKESDDE